MRPLLLSKLLLIGLLASARAATTSTWDGGGGVNDNWGAAANWVGDIVPYFPAYPTPGSISGTTAVDPNLAIIRLAGTTPDTSTVDANWYIDTLYFNSTNAGAFTLSGSEITFRPSNGTSHDSRLFLVNESGKAQVINNNLVVLPANHASSTGSGISVGNAASTTTLNGDVAFYGTGVRIKGGVGTVVFNGVVSSPNNSDSIAVTDGATAVFNNGANTFTKGLSIWNGTIKVGATGALGLSSSDIGMGHPTAFTNLNSKLLTTGAVNISRNVALTSTTTTQTYTIGGEGPGVSNFSGSIFNGAAYSYSASTPATLPAPWNGGTTADRQAYFDRLAASVAISLTSDSPTGKVNVNAVVRRSTSTSSTGTDTLTKTGAGIVALTGASNYGGLTDVKAGTLLVNGSLSSTAAYNVYSGATVQSSESFNADGVVVRSGATLGGTGTVNRAITLEIGGRLSLGDMDPSGASSSGTLTGASLLWNSGDQPSLFFDLGTVSDRLTLSGAFTRGEGTNFLFSFTNIGGMTPRTYSLVDFGSTDFTISDFDYVGPAGLVGDFVINGNTLEFQAQAVPEPASGLALMGGAAILLQLRRRSSSWEISTGSESGSGPCLTQ